MLTPANVFVSADWVVSPRRDVGEACTLLLGSKHCMHIRQLQAKYELYGALLQKSWHVTQSAKGATMHMPALAVSFRRRGVDIRLEYFHTNYIQKLSITHYTCLYVLDIIVSIAAIAIHIAISTEHMKWHILIWQVCAWHSLRL